MEDDEWMKLAVEDKVVHKLWKARVWISISPLLYSSFGNI